jgi:hypothetical protein
LIEAQLGAQQWSFMRAKKKNSFDRGATWRSTVEFSESEKNTNKIHLVEARLGAQQWSFLREKKKI